MPARHDIAEVLLEGHRGVALRARETAVEAVFVPALGLVGASLRHEGAELLGQRAGLSGYVERSSTMGLPLLHPWANRLGATAYEAAGRRVALDPGRMPIKLDPHGLPIHGVRGARLPFSVEATEAGDAGARLRARLGFDTPDLLAVFPFPHVLRAEVGLAGATLTMRTTLEAGGDHAVPVAFGYHPYLVLPGVPRADWHVEAPVRRRVVADERGVPTGERAAADPVRGRLGGAVWDEGYDRLDPDAAFRLRGGGRELVLRFLEGYPCAQLFAPPGDDLVAFEPMTAPADALRAGGPGLRTVAPGERFTAAFALEVHRR
jgi:aldose 1-epimerase